MRGTIKKLTEKGYGFISPSDAEEEDGNDKDLFFHANSLIGVEYDALEVGDEMEFEVEESEKGKNAINVSRVA